MKFKKGDKIIWHDEFYHGDCDGCEATVIFGNNKTEVDAIYIAPKDVALGHRWVTAEDCSHV